MTWRDEYGRERKGQRILSTAMIPPPEVVPADPAPGTRRTDPPMLAYDLPLRPDLIIRLTLPRDFTPEDAERLCGIIRTLAFQQRDPDIWVTTESVNRAVAEESA